MAFTNGLDSRLGVFLDSFKGDLLNIIFPDLLAKLIWNIYYF
jgi:hypothetical protein